MHTVPSTELPEAPVRRERDEPPWPAWTAPAALVGGFVIAQLVAVVPAVISHANGASLSSPPASVNIINNYLFDLSFVAAAVTFARVFGARGPGVFGFRRLTAKTAIGAVVLSGVGYYVFSFVYGALIPKHPPDKLPSDLGVHASTSAAIAVTIFVCVVAPICEELFFRGFIFGALRKLRITVGSRELGVWVAAVLTGILFGLAHAGSAPAEYLVPLAFLGFVLCIVRWRTGSLYPCIALHSINNVLALGITEFHWTLGQILALMAGCGLAIAAVTGPLAPRSRQPA